MKKPTKRQINFSVTEEEYQYIKKMSQHLGYKSVASYCYMAVFRSFFVSNDGQFPTFWESFKKKLGL